MRVDIELDIHELVEEAIQTGAFCDPAREIAWDVAKQALDEVWDRIDSDVNDEALSVTQAEISDGRSIYDRLVDELRNPGPELKTALAQLVQDIVLNPAPAPTTTT